MHPPGYPIRDNPGRIDRRRPPWWILWIVLMVWMVLLVYLIDLSGIF